MNETVERYGASTANYRFIPTRSSFSPAYLAAPVDDVKKALPRFDEESHLTHQSKEGHMSGKAAKTNLTTRRSEM